MNILKETRVRVLVIVDRLKEGKSFEEILENSPAITRVDIQEIIA